MDHDIIWDGRGMEPPRTVFGQGPLAALADSLGVAGITLALAFLLTWHARAPFLTRLLPGQPYDLAVVVVAGVYFAALYRWLTSRLQRVLLGADCLTLCYHLRQRQIPWDAIQRIERVPGRFRVGTTDDIVEFTAHLRHADILLANAQHRIESPVAAEVFEPGGSARAGDRLLGALVWLPTLLLATIFNALLPEPRYFAIADSASAWLVAGMLLAQALWLRRQLRERRLRRLEVTADGLRIVNLAGLPQDLRWSQVEGAGYVGDRLVLRLAGGVRRLPLPDEVARAAAATIQARRAAADPAVEQVFEQPAEVTLGLQLATWCGYLGFAVLCCLQARATRFDYAWETPLLRLALLGILGAAVRQMLPRLVRRVTVDDDGVRLDDGQRVTELPWSTIRGASRSATAWQIDTSVGAVRFGGVFGGQDELLERIRFGLAKAQASVSEKERVEHAEIAGWLGITADDCLEVRALRAGPLVIGGVVWAGIVLLGVLAYRPSLTRVLAPLATATAPVWVFWLLYYPVHLAILLRADALRRVYASGHGLRWRNGSVWRQAGWNEVLSCSLVPREHQRQLFYWSDVQVAADREVLVECVGQRLRFHPKDQHAERLQRALERLLKARRAGLTMPGLSAVPANAISRAEPRDASAELGLSRVEPES